MNGQQSCESLKRERDELKREVEEARYEAERESERRDRERQTQRQEREQERRRQLPSNRLYNGDVTDFEEAVQCHIAACEQEVAIPEPDDSDGLRDTITRCNQTMRESIGRAGRARAVYQRITAETEERITAALRDEGLEEWATCLESGDYSSMAI